MGPTAQRANKVVIINYTSTSCNTHWASIRLEVNFPPTKPKPQRGDTTGKFGMPTYQPKVQS